MVRITDCLSSLSYSHIKSKYEKQYRNKSNLTWIIYRLQQEFLLISGIYVITYHMTFQILRDFVSLFNVLLDLDF